LKNFEHHSLTADMTTDVKRGWCLRWCRKQCNWRKCGAGIWSI